MNLFWSFFQVSDLQLGAKRHLQFTCHQVASNDLTTVKWPQMTWSPVSFASRQWRKRPRGCSAQPMLNNPLHETDISSSFRGALPQFNLEMVLVDPRRQHPPSQRCWNFVHRRYASADSSRLAGGFSWLTSPKNFKKVSFNFCVSLPWRILNKNVPPGFRTWQYRK